MTHITGRLATEHGDMSFNGAVAAWNAGKLLVVNSEAVNPADPRVVANHA